MDIYSLRHIEVESPGYPRPPVAPTSERPIIVNVLPPGSRYASIEELEDEARGEQTADLLSSSLPAKAIESQLGPQAS